MSRLTTLVCALLATLTPLAAAAQGFGELLRPGPLSAEVAVDGLWTAAADVRPGAAEVDETRAGLALLLPLAQGPAGEWALTASADRWALGGLPAELGTPDEVWDLRAGVIHRRPLAAGRRLFAVATVGSASDEPFASFDEVELQGIAGLTIPRSERSSWLLMAVFSNNRQFLNWVPLPAAGLLFHPSRNLTAAVGLPFAWIQARPHERLQLDASYFPLVNLNAGATWSAGGRLRLRAAFEWDAETFLPADRIDEDQRLYVEERRVLAAALWAREGWDLELAAGQSLERRRFISEDYSGEERFARIDLDDAPFVRLRIRRSF